MPDTGVGILKPAPQGAGFLFDLDRQAQSVYVPAELIRKHSLPYGAVVSGPVRHGKRGPMLADVELVCNQRPESFRARKPFQRLVAVDPCERINLPASGDVAMRVVDLIAPIGKGTRGLIVSPPKAGKTTLLEQIAVAAHAADPQTRIIAVLINERPEEVTHFRRTVPAEVFASSSDQRASEQVALAELMLAHIQTELECGRDILVLVDSLTRMARIYNLQTGSGRGGRTLSGGLEAGALEIPRRFFGLARNIEHEGSVTIIATALIETNSRMDQLIFEEFKGTGNSEIVLDRGLAEAHIFPAINIAASGTRKEHLLYTQDELRPVVRLRRALAGRSPKEAMSTLLRLLQRYPTNRDLLESLPAEI
jgi:transcription termination factor Rho